MISVVIPAHNEAAVIGRCLDLLLADRAGTPLDITVVANGCSDRTAELARARPGVRVIEVPEASKSAALNVGDATAAGWPRVYLDADITLSPGDVRRLAAAVESGPALAAVPRRRLLLHGRPLLVRAYYAVQRRLPVFRCALFGRGAVAVSEVGRGRFDRFPDALGDDLFLDSRFRDHEKCEVPEVVSAVAAPRRTADLVRRLARVRAGNTALRARTAGVCPAARTAWLRHVVLPRPWLAPAAVAYVALTVAAALQARLRPAEWGQDTSSRVARPEGAGVD
jgi:glycosyltransferase involved in cell wall biosynthesis